MKKFLLLLIIPFLSFGQDEYVPQSQRTNQKGLVFGTINFSGDEQGYSFDEEKIYQLSSSWIREGEKLNNIDIAWSDFHLATPKYSKSSYNDIRDYRIHHSDSDDYWQFAYGPDVDGVGQIDIKINDVFFLKTHKGTYVKLIVKDINDITKALKIEYVHQLNGTKIFE